jgi:hypothetical protein
LDDGEFVAAEERDVIRHRLPALEQILTDDVGLNDLRDALLVGLEGVTAERRKDVEKAQKRLAQSEVQRRKLLQLVYDGKMPDDLFQEEQDRLKAVIKAAESAISEASQAFDSLEEALDIALELAEAASDAYTTSRFGATPPTQSGVLPASLPSRCRWHQR